MSTISLPAAPSRNITLSHILQARRDYVSKELEAVCQKAVRPRILSVSNGRLREAEAVLSLCRNRSGEFVALDRNPEVLETLRQEYGPGRIRCVADLDPCREEKFHYIYALNVLNEIHDPAARQLLAKLAAMLYPGGCLLVSSFTPEMKMRGYSDEIRWQPVCRTETDMARLADMIPDSDMIGHVMWRDDTETIVYLEIQK